MNKSKYYGFYGGVTKENYYVPPEDPPYVPCLPTVPFYGEYINTLNELLCSTSFTDEYLLQHFGEILLRRLRETTETDKVFEMFTDNNPSDFITYSVPLTAETIDLLHIDAGNI